MATNFVQIENESEIKQRLEAERARLRKIAGLDQPNHFHRPVERAFTADRGRTPQSCLVASRGSTRT